MIRIVAGELGGRRLLLPADDRVRPTAERVREAWMSMLGDRLAGARVLDLFAGSGALGFEALSRGAEQCTFVDLAAASIEAIQANAKALGVVERVTIRRADAMRFLRQLRPHQYDIAMADPPYSVRYAERLIERFREQPFATLLTVEHPASVQPPADHTRRYGDIALSFCDAR